MKGIRQLKAMFDDPRMKELIVSLWREYPGLYNEKYNRSVGELVEPWLSNNFSEDVQFGQALGQDHSINGNQSTAIGIGAITRAFREMILGSYANDTAALSADTWNILDLLFVLGNGVDSDNTSNAIEVYKSGLVKLFNAIQIGDYAYGTDLPGDGIIKYLKKKLELSFDGAWHELALKGEITETSFIVIQVSHGFTVGNTIKLSGATWIKTQANIPGNAGTVALVSEIVDFNNFKYITGGLLAGTYTLGAEYFLSVLAEGELMILADPEVWELGNVREFIGTGTEGGLQIEIDSGEVINPDMFDDKFVTQLLFDTQTRLLTAKRSAGLSDLQIPIPIGISLVNPNWNVTDPLDAAFIIGKPVLAPIAISGNYADLAQKPTLADKFTELTDVIPSDYIGRKNSMPIVTEEEDKLDLIETEILETEVARFILMADCPQTYAGMGGYAVRVKLDETGLEFIAP